MVGRLKQHFVRFPGRMREFQGLSVKSKLKSACEIVECLQPPVVRLYD